MADVKFFSEKKPSVFQPDADMEVKRRRRLAEQMIANSQQPQGTEIISGMAVKQSPLAALARALQGGIGSYEQKQADQMDADAQKRRQDMMAQALGSYAKDPNAAAQMLGQDPNTSDMAFRIMQSELENRRRQEQDARNFAQQKEIMGMRIAAGANGGNAPAAIQIMNEVQKRLQAGDTQGANMLMQIAKVYDKGVNPFGDAPSGGVGLPVQGSAPNNLPNVFDVLPMGGEAQPMPMQGNPNNPPNLPKMSFQPIQGYGEAVGSIAETKKNMETMGQKNAEIATAQEIERQKSIGAPLPSTIVSAQDEILDKINVSQGISQKMEKFKSQIDTGQLNLGLIANLENKARNNLSMSTQESANLASFQSALENLRNESLRLNTGVQTDGDAQRAWSELIANINDPRVVRQRLDEIDQINKLGAALQEQRLNVMRSEYGRSPLQTTGQQNAQPQIAVNPQTGERLINRGNGWEPYNGQ